MILLAVLNPVYAGPGIELPYLMSLDLLQPVLTRCVGRMGGTMYDRSNPDVLEFVERQAHFDLPNYNTDPFATEATVQAALAQEYITLINGELAGMGRPLRFEFLGPTTPTGSSLLRTNQPLWPDRCKWPAPQAAGQPVTVFLGTVVEHCLTTAPLDAAKTFGPSPSRKALKVTLPWSSSYSLVEVLQAASEQHQANWHYTCQEIVFPPGDPFYGLNTGWEGKECNLFVWEKEVAYKDGEDWLLRSLSSRGPTGCTYFP